MYELFPSPHSGILFLSYPRWDLSQIYKDSFRPLIRGFFFYVGNVPSLVMAHQRVSVPSFGDSFFIHYENQQYYWQVVSVPSFGDSFFIFFMRALVAALISVSVPSFGDSFFIGNEALKVRINNAGFRPLIRGFFFYYIEYRKYNDDSHEEGFRPLIRGFFFYISAIYFSALRK